MFLQQPSQPFMVRLVPPAPAHQTTLGEVILGSLAVVAVGVMVAACCGALAAIVIARWRRRHPAAPDGPPSISPLPRDESRPTSPRAR